MRASTGAILAIVLTGSAILVPARPVSAAALAGNGYSSSYAGESVFEDRAAGQTAQNSAIFFNDGTQPWLPGVVGLLVCLPDKVTCNVPSPNATYASGWYSSTVYATVSSTIAPGQNGFFVYNFAVPAGTPGNTTVTFNGDLGIIATGAELRPEGYFQQNTTPPIVGTLTISPTSASLPVGGQQQFTATTNLTGSIAWSVTGGCGGVTSAGSFTAISLGSATQPCSVAAMIGGLTASARVTVFGQPASLSCSASPASLVANGGVAPDGVTTVSVAIKDANGNAVTNSTLGVTATNGSTSLATITSPISVSAVNGVAAFTIASILSTGQVAIAMSASATITTCTAVIPIVAAGPPAQLYATVNPTAIGADGVSTATLRIDVQDVKGDRTLDAGTTVDVVVSGSACTLSGVVTGAGSASGSSATATAMQGRIEITVASTLVAGTCSFTATPHAGSLAGSSATLTTRFVGQPVRLSVLGNDSPHAAGSASTTNVTVAVLDGAGTQVSRSTLPITALPPSGGACTGAGGGDVVVSSPGTTTGGQAVFQFTSNGAYGACVVIFTATGVTATQATIAFTPGGADHLGCVFLPTTIGADGSSTAAALVTIQDQLGNTVAAGSYGVALNRTGGSGVTSVSGNGPLTTVAGVAAFQVRSTGTTPGADVYTPAVVVGTLPHVGPDRGCTLSATH